MQSITERTYLRYQDVHVRVEVINDQYTYLFPGTRGIAVTFVASGDEEKRFRAIEQESGVRVDLLPGQCMLVVIILYSLLVRMISYYCSFDI